MSTVDVLQRFELFYVTQSAAGEINDWTSTVALRKADLTREETQYIRELTTLAAMEYAAFFQLVERVVTPENRAIQVDERAARAAQARCDSPPSECYGMTRFVRDEARMDDLFLFTSDLQKVEDTRAVDVKASVADNELTSFVQSIESYQGMFDGTWVGDERVVMRRVPAIWVARWALNGAQSVASSGRDFQSNLERYPELFGLFATAT